MAAGPRRWADGPVRPNRQLLIARRSDHVEIEPVRSKMSTKVQIMLLRGPMDIAVSPGRCAYPPGPSGLTVRDELSGRPRIDGVLRRAVAMPTSPSCAPDSARRSCVRSRAPGPSYELLKLERSV